jgi:hypothetical protein
LGAKPLDAFLADVRKLIDTKAVED